MRRSDWSSDVCSSDLTCVAPVGRRFSDFFPALAPYFDCNTSPTCDLELAYEQAQQLGPRKQIANGDPFSRQTIWGISNTTTIELGDITLKNIFGYRRSEERRVGKEWLGTVKTWWSP